MKQIQSETVSIFDYGDLPEEWQEIVCDEQPNDSYRRVSPGMSKYGRPEWDEIWQWAVSHGAVVQEDYPYVLFRISW